MKMETESGVMQLQVKEHQGSLGTIRSQETGMEQSLPQSLHKEPNLVTHWLLTFGFLDCKIIYFCSFKLPVCDICGDSPRKLIHIKCLNSRECRCRVPPYMDTEYIRAPNIDYFHMNVTVMVRFFKTDFPILHINFEVIVMILLGPLFLRKLI